MRNESPYFGGAPFVGSQSPEIERTAGARRMARSIGWASYKTVGYLTGTLDYALILIACIASGVAYHGLVLGGSVPDFMQYVGAGNMVAALFILGSASQGNYSPNKIVSARLQVRSIILCWTLALVSFAFFLFLAKSGRDFSRGTIIIFGILGLFLLLVFHVWVSAALKEALAQGMLSGDSAITIGDHESVAGLSQASILWKSGAREMRRYLLPPFTKGGWAEGLRLIDDAIKFTRANKVDCILLALQWSDEHRRNLICERLQVLPVPVLLLPDRHVESIFSQGQKLGREFTIEIQRPPLSTGELALKRAFDVVATVGLLVLLAPLFALVALLIKLDSPGAVIFRQSRKGFNGREFTIFKFRTMNVMENGAVIQQACRNDSRVTRVGRVLRATSIDELPQLLNVLQGCMSLIGPRPHANAHDDGYSKVIANYAFRQNVKPGLTRLGSSQRLPRRDRAARADGATRRLRSLVHQKLELLARSADTCSHRLRASKASQCLLRQTWPPFSIVRTKRHFPHRGPEDNRANGKR